MEPIKNKLDYPLIFRTLTETSKKNIVEKCGKLLSEPQKLYLCSRFWHENGSSRRAENYFLMPNLYIISGCNGAGKTTASLTVLPETLQCKEFVNCDEIAKGLSPLNPDGAKVAAGRLMLTCIKKHIADKVDFAIETTLAAKSYHSLIIKAREQGYKTSLVYFWLQSPDLAIQRVAERVKHGGHHVEDSIIRRRYRAGIKNLFNLYCPVVDYFLFIDNSIMPSEVIAEGNIKSIKFYNEEKFKKIRQYDNSNSESQEE